MKYVVCIPDGCSDRPSAARDGRTPLEVADMPVLDGLAARATGGGIMPGFMITVLSNVEPAAPLMD